MKSIRRSALMLLSVAVCGMPTPAWAWTAEQPESQAKGDLRLLIIGNDAQRRGEYASFLRGHFAAVDAVARDDFDPASFDADIVLLDWRQNEIDQQNGGFAALESPLGPREAWETPTVLLGSAGLLLSAPWQTSGSYG